jgi:hypothetical protein
MTGRLLADEARARAQLSDTEWQQYERVRGPAWAEYWRAVGPAWAEYEAAADQDLEAAGAEYTRVWAAATEARDRACGAALRGVCAARLDGGAR